MQGPSLRFLPPRLLLFVALVRRRYSHTRGRPILLARNWDIGRKGSRASFSTRLSRSCNATRGSIPRLISCNDPYSPRASERAAASPPFPRVWSEHRENRQSNNLNVWRKRISIFDNYCELHVLFYINTYYLFQILRMFEMQRWDRYRAYTE